MFRFIFPIVLVLISGLLFLVLLGPVFNNPRVVDSLTGKVISGGIFSLRKEVSAINDALTNAYNFKEKISSLESLYQSIPNNTLKNIDVILPDNPRFILLYPELIKIGESSGLALKNIVVNVNEGNQDNNLKTIAISFSTAGNYKQLLSFLDDLASNMRIMDIKSLTISQPNRGDSTVDGLYDFAFNLEAYWLKN